jgi:hypothetical protein
MITKNIKNQLSTANSLAKNAVTAKKKFGKRIKIGQL